MSPAEEEAFLKSLFKEKLGLDIDRRQAVIGGYLYKYGLLAAIFVILASAFLLVHLPPLLYFILLLIITLSSILFCGNAEFYYFDDEKIIRIREKGLFSPSYNVFNIYFRDITEIHAYTRSRKGYTTRNYRIRMSNTPNLAIKLSWEANSTFINRFETHLIKKLGNRVHIE